MVAQRYRKFASKIQDWRPAWERIIKEAIQPMIIRHFEQGGVDGQKYMPLKPETIRHKARRGYPAVPLIRSKRWMRNASSRMVWAVTKNDCRLVPSRLRWYGVIHETGKPARNLPSRPVFVWDQQFYADLGRIANEWVQEQIDGS
jgi:hypothetical protein